MIILGKELNKLITTPKNIEEITSLKITEIESFIEEEFKPLDNVCCGNVLTCIPHPDSDHMHITTVDTGDGKLLQIVCGAKNVAAGQSVIVAKEGAILPGNFKIAPVKLRGVDSYGMLCSLKELGLDKLGLSDVDGIYVFDKTIKPGNDYIKELGLDGFLLDISITPNRGDLLSLYGFSKDLSACCGRKFKEEEFNYKTGGADNKFNISVESSNCDYYSVRYLKNVEVKESPIWLKSFISRMGLKPQNNVVDITNYIMFKYGTPMHAFDISKLSSDNNIIIRDAKKGEKVLTLQNEEVGLNGGECLICDSEKTIAIAGVIGLENSKVDTNTKEIILESAVFKRESIQSTSKNLKIETDASIRFQRGVSITMQEKAQDEALFLLSKIANATISKKLVKKTITKDNKKQIKITLSDINNLLGSKLKVKEVKDIFDNLDFTNTLEGEKFSVTPPHYRFDINIKEDLIEEVARIYGYNNLKGEPATLSLFNKPNRFLQFEDKIKQYLIAHSFNEVITHTLVKEEIKNEYLQSDDLFKVLTPITEDHLYVRSKVYPSLIETYLYNINRKVSDVNLFEISNVYTKKNNKKVLSLLLSSNLSPNSHIKTLDNEPTFFTLKGILESLCNIFNIKLEYLKTNFESIHPGMQAQITSQGQVIGHIFKVIPKKELDNVICAEIDLNALYPLCTSKKSKFCEISKFPTVKRDIAFTISKSIHYLDIENKIIENAGENLKELVLFDLYNIDDKNYSLAYHLIFSDNKKTLESNYIQNIIDDIIKELSSSFGAILR